MDGMMSFLKKIGSVLLRPSPQVRVGGVSPDMIALALYTTQDIRSEEHARKFFSILKGQDKRFMPTRWEPPDKPGLVKLDLDDLEKPVQEWGSLGGLHMEAGGTQDDRDLMWYVQGYGWSGWFSGTGMLIRDSVLGTSESDVERLIGLAVELYDLLNAVYGRIEAGGEDDRGSFINASIPNVYWVNFFGRPYVDMFGAEKLRTAPCYRVQELFDGGFMLMLTATREEALSQEGRAKAQAVKEHLGIEYFFHPSDVVRGNVRDCRRRTVPAFDLSHMPDRNTAGMKWVKSREQPPLDPEEFIRGVPSFVEALKARMGDRGAGMDFSKKSLEELDAWAVEQYSENSSWEYWESREISNEFAAYLGEVIGRLTGGEWKVEEVRPGLRRAVVRFGKGKRKFFDPLPIVEKVTTEGLDESVESMREEGGGFAAELWTWMTTHLPLEAVKDII